MAVNAAGWNPRGQERARVRGIRFHHLECRIRHEKWALALNPNAARPSSFTIRNPLHVIAQNAANGAKDLVGIRKPHATNEQNVAVHRLTPPVIFRYHRLARRCAVWLNDLTWCTHRRLLSP